MHLGELDDDRKANLAIAAAVAATAGLGSLGTVPVIEGRWYQKLDKPPWQPPDAAFGPVWTVLYGMLAAAAMAYRRRAPEPDRQGFYVLLGSNLALNAAWTFIFFRGRSPLAAGVEIVALEGTCLALIVRAWPRSRASALALVPYAAWVAFAAALTWSIALRNR